MNLIVKLLLLERFSSDDDDDDDDDDIIDSGKNNTNVDITNHLLFIHETGILALYYMY